MVVPGGVDRSGQQRVIPALLALVKRLAARHELRIFALAQEPRPGSWMLHGARVTNIGGPGGALRGLRTVVALRRAHGEVKFDLIQSIWSGSCGLAAVIAAKSLGLPALVHIAGGELVALPQIQYGGRLTLAGRMREALVLRSAAQVTAASVPIIEQLAALGCRARRVPLGVDLKQWPPQAPRRRDLQAPIRLIHIASLNPVKDQITLMKALARLAAEQVAFSMDVVGEDTLGGRIQALSWQLGLAPRVTFHGFLTQPQLRPLLERAHIHLISSLHEAGPLAVLEAAVLGVPTVGTAVGHIAEWAPVAASAVPVGDPQALAAALRQMIADEERRLGMAAEAARRALSENADHTCAQFEQLYAELAG